jgi:hypothetical protein
MNLHSPFQHQNEAMADNTPTSSYTLSLFELPGTRGQPYWLQVEFMSRPVANGTIYKADIAGFALVLPLLPKSQGGE